MLYIAGLVGGAGDAQGVGCKEVKILIVMLNEFNI